jgi:hypothetical protein
MLPLFKFDIFYIIVYILRSYALLSRPPGINRPFSRIVYPSQIAYLSCSLVQNLHDWNTERFLASTRQLNNDNSRHDRENLVGCNNLLLLDEMKGTDVVPQKRTNTIY